VWPCDNFNDGVIKFVESLHNTIANFAFPAHIKPKNRFDSCTRAVKVVSVYNYVVKPSDGVRADLRSNGMAGRGRHKGGGDAIDLTDIINADINGPGIEPKWVVCDGQVNISQQTRVTSK
jgi:hypothetical protein